LLKLTIATPNVIIVNIDNIRSVRAEDSTGAFGILPGHADLLTVLAIGVLIWRDVDGLEHCAALRGGVLRVRDGQSVEVATREAIIGDDLKNLKDVVVAQMTRNAETEQAARLDALALQHAAIQKIYHYLRPAEQPADPLLRK
jgi:F-type H+-transporting ATPase subunit epsilon